MASTTYILRKGQTRSDDIKTVVTTITANGAAPIKNGVVLLGGSGARAVTLAVPTTAQNGTKITFVALTAAAHTVTATTVGFNETNASGDVATFGAAIGNGFTVIAYAGEWYTVGALTNVTLG